MKSLVISEKLRGDLLRASASVIAIALAFATVGIFLAASGRNPVAVYFGMFRSAFGNSFSITETLVVATPIMLCALGVSIAARVGLLNVGAEGQLYLGAIGATFVALRLPESPAWLLIPLMMLGAGLCGAAWSAVPGFLRTKFEVNETIVTLLMNYVALLLVEYLVHGAWQDPESFSWPQTPAFTAAAELPRWGTTRLHLGFVMAIVTAMICWLTFSYTRIGFVTRVIGNNLEAAEYAHYPVFRYLIVAMALSGAIAALAGLGQVSAIEGRLRTGISPGYGYTGFLVAWLARNHPLAIIGFAIFLGGLLSGSDSLQLREGLPFATVNILQGAILLFLLCADYAVEKVQHRWN